MGQPKAHFNILSSYAGLGDQIARLPALRYMLETYEHVSATVYWQDYSYDLMTFLYEHRRLRQRKLSEAGYHLAPPVVEFDPERLMSRHMHLTEHAFLILMDRLPPTRASRHYIKANEYNGFVPDSPVGKMVVFTPCYTAPAREWPAVYINETARRTREAGYTPVLLGTTQLQDAGEGKIAANLSPDVDRSLFVDLIDKTNLLQALGVIQKATAVVGVDNGLIHLAHCTSTSVVVGYTSVTAALTMPDRPEGKTVVIEPKNPHYGWQSNSFAVNRDFRFPKPEEFTCNIEMAASRFIEGLNELGLNI